MASNGTLNTNDYHGRYLSFTWSEVSQSITNNTTTISWQLKGAGVGQAGWYRTGAFKVVIEGETVYSSETRIQLYNGTLVAEGSYTFKHDADGSKKFTVYIEAGLYTVAVNCTGSTTFTLDTIPRASSLTAENGTLGTKQTFSIDRASTSFKHRLTYKCGEVSGYIAGSTTGYTTATSIDWTPPIGLAAQNTKGTSVTIQLTLYTYASDGTHIGTTVREIVCTMPASVKPSCTVALTDTTDIYAQYGFVVVGLSKVKASITTQTSQGAAIKEYVSTANGVRYTGNPVEVDVLGISSGVFAVNTTVTDTRGRSGSYRATIPGYVYAAAKISKLTVLRCNEDGTENDHGEFAKVTFSAAVDAMAGWNTAAYKLRYKDTEAASYTEVAITALANTFTVTNYSYIFAADGNRAFDVEIEVTDSHSSDSRATSISTAFTLMNWHPSGTGMGIGKVSETEDTLEITLETDFQGPAFGRVYGLALLPAIPAGGDLNNYTAPGCYAIRTSADAGTIKNIPPIAESGRLFVSVPSGQSEGSVNDVWGYREQRFVPFKYGHGYADQGAWLRYISKENTQTWSFTPWFNEALKAYPIGSIHMRYDTKNPANLFGGEWTQITARVLRAGSAGSIGTEGTIADGSGRTYIDVAVWRRIS